MMILISASYHDDINNILISDVRRDGDGVIGTTLPTLQKLIIKLNPAK